jgi:hypothetical protein
VVSAVVTRYVGQARRVRSRVNAPARWWRQGQVVSMRSTS